MKTRSTSKRSNALKNIKARRNVISFVDHNLLPKKRRIKKVSNASEKQKFLRISEAILKEYEKAFKELTK